MLLLIDNYDSFTHNLARYFSELGQDVRVVRNDSITLAQIETLAPQYLVISPGPCTPNESGISLAAIQQFSGKIPILGVCLGHQAIAQAFGARVVRATTIMHGKTSLVQHVGSGLFNGVSHPCEVTRYHSLVVEPSTVPDCFEITAWVEENQQQTVMALAHKHWPLYGVQFHPESVLTTCGHQLLDNFLHSARQGEKLSA